MPLSQNEDQPAAVVVTAVLPRYRAGFLAELERVANVRFYAGAAHSDASVVTAVEKSRYTPVRNVFLLGRRAFLQMGALSPAMRAPVTVVDLNPRSLTAWVLLLGRRALGKPVLAWGHIFPRSGPDSKTMFLRRGMMALSHGLIAYTLSDRKRAVELSGKPTWAATNALYSSAELLSHQSSETRTDFLYVGRLEMDKKVHLLLNAFEIARRNGWVNADTRLRFIGAGSEEDRLREYARAGGLGAQVVFEGPKYTSDELSRAYRYAIAAVSPGYGGLLITQSVGFGCAIVLPTDEPHAPEVELAQDPWTRWFLRDDAESLAEALRDLVRCPPGLGALRDGAALVREHYSTDNMARGFAEAICEVGARHARP